MTSSLPWIERKFESAPRVELFPVALERLRGLTPRLHDKLSGTRSARLRERVESTWSVAENVGHLDDLEPLWQGRLDDFLAGDSELRRADLSNSRTEERDHNARSPANVVADLESSRARLIGRLEQLSLEDFGRTSKHPRLMQSMRLYDLVLFIAEHDDHHLARVHELLGRPSSA